MRGGERCRFRGAIGISQLDLMGFSIGRNIAPRRLRLRHPGRSGRLILVGTARPRRRPHRRDPGYAQHGALTDPAQPGKAQSRVTFICSFARQRRAKRPEDVWAPAARDERKTSTCSQVGTDEWRRNGRRSPNGVTTTRRAVHANKASGQPTLIVNGHKRLRVPTIN